mmetsp:Transcript_17044/g.31340  ORF Transcript_17044/g.31340 Transcript_17044/m.31340 type:complete len:90 (+) Transcript_17044:399-668(+)
MALSEWHGGAGGWAGRHRPNAAGLILVRRYKFVHRKTNPSKNGGPTINPIDDVPCRRAPDPDRTFVSASRKSVSLWIKYYAVDTAGLWL